MLKENDIISSLGTHCTFLWRLHTVTSGQVAFDYHNLCKSGMCFHPLTAHDRLRLYLSN